MFYRRKLILALIEAFGGRLNRTDCLKLLLVFCQETGQNYFDFFPHRYGSYSFLVFQDKARLEVLGYLAQDDSFKLNPGASLPAIKKSDKTELDKIAVRWAGSLGKSLIKEVYLKYPYFASRSNIAKNILSPGEFLRVSESITLEETPCLFSLGYEGRSIDAYINILIKNNIKALVDVRKNPNSMKYGFSKRLLKTYTGKVGVEYYHLPDLGIPSELRQNLKTDADYQALFNRYEKEILSNQTDALTEVLELLQRHKRITLMCFEADPEYCHRNKIISRLKTMIPDTEINQI